MKRDLRYNPTDIFETFPFPQNLSIDAKAEVDLIGEQYYEFRHHLMLNLNLGLTKTYNLYHDQDCQPHNIEKVKDIREFKFATMKISLSEAINNIQKLRHLHKQMDEAVLKAYGWTDINLSHDFHEVDYLPDNDRIRYTISPEARKEILKRLLALNHQIHAEELESGKWANNKNKKKSNPAVAKEQGKLFN
jgi:hypothetical protein